MRDPRITLMSSIALLTTLFSGAVLAQAPASAFPTKPVTMIIPQAAGGPTDPEARRYAAKLTDLMGQPFLVDFKAGAGATIGSNYVAKSTPDGHTLLVVAASFTTFPALYKDLPFDTIKDFSPVSLVSKRSIILVANAAFPAKNYTEYIAYAKANPGKINFGTSGVGGVSHLGGAWLHNATGSQVTFVHYKGTGALVTDLVSGRLDVAPAALSPVLPMIKAGKLKVLVLMNNERSKLLPGMQTISEQGIPAYDYSSWTGMSGPAGIPAAIVNKLSEGFAKVVRMPDMVAPLEADGGMPVGSTPAQYGQFLIGETERWRKVVQESGIKLEQ